MDEILIMQYSFLIFNEIRFAEQVKGLMIHWLTYILLLMPFFLFIYTIVRNNTWEIYVVILKFKQDFFILIW